MTLHRRLTEYFNIQSILVPICAILLALGVGAIVMLLVGDNPIEAYAALLYGMFGTWDRVAASLGRSTPYIGAALGVAFAFRAGLFNIGVEGQLLVGATVAAWVGTWGVIGDLWGWMALPIIILAGAIGGGLYGAIPGVLKARTGAHEVITTIMLNNIAVLIIRWMVNSDDPLLLKDPSGSRPQSRPLPLDTRLTELPPDWDFLPKFLRDIRGTPPLHLGFLVMVGLCVVVWFILQRTTTGFEIRSVGANPHASRYAGMRIGFIIVLVMTASGALAGVAGAGQVAGTYGFLVPGAFVAIGFDGIAIALLARANPFAIIPAAILWGAMLYGANYMQQEAGVSIDIVRIIQALVLLFIAADVIVRSIFHIKKVEDLGAMKEARLGASWGET